MTGVLCKDCEYNKETNLFHTGRYCMRLGAICGLLGCEEGVPKVKANADRIRSMTDEELAKWLVLIEQRILELQPTLERPALLADWLEWLKEEVKDGSS